MRKVNIGCATYQREGWINIDKNPLMRPDIVRDVARGLPFDTSSVDEILASHVLEHLSSEDLIFFIGESYRVLVPGGVLEIIVPLGNTGGLDHKMQFCEDSFDMLCLDENAAYLQLEMNWRTVDGSKVVKPSSGAYSHLQALHIQLRAIK